MLDDAQVKRETAFTARLNELNELSSLVYDLSFTERNSDPKGNYKHYAYVHPARLCLFLLMSHLFYL